ncbi:hypothetical protein TPHA_0E01830 [Tetrapisispora phaffii CBS 4417]|uniref:Septin-type G domain-containing protein n=1 Tax=Tetrapisispora phaffii (strain ATCC 24235 / CBS 4417 / NBRC 1672 / NRRL Y-8282 / UCD 70-5) TaxID=1071381 RepID=G8BTP8_TETPH|nr:hypothetical protein TPHA_0E01830 [Tetrapisispora phaffii CBS 4417]CCE63276.1 hypothetical protein TPHA_0E01830 [Tetrapisispora phaffii CBS 4417]
MSSIPVSAENTSQIVGISNLPNQRYKIVNEHGGHFTMMVCGESGLGKTTFVNTLFQTTLKHCVQRPTSSSNTTSSRKTVEIDVIRAVLEEKNFKLRVNVIDTPGFGDNVNNNKAWQRIIDFLDDQHDSYMRQEQQPYRDIKFDLRVHVVLYFIKPTGHGLKPLDIETMKKIATRANLIPVIAKSDTLTQQELNTFKLRIRQVIEAQDIKIFTPPIDENVMGSSGNPIADANTDENSVAFNNTAAMEHARQLIESMPFAVVGSEHKFTNAQGTEVIARKYPWGLVEVENDAHCDFRKLRSLLLRTNLLDLILSTEDIHYESYRALRLGGSKQEETDNSSVPIPTPARKLLSSNPKYKEEENALKKYFTEQVKAEEQRFRQWEQNIVNERLRLNSDLKDIQDKVKKLEDQVRNLQLKKY